MELWHIVVICTLMIPLFLLANYLMVKSAVKNMKEKDELMEKALTRTVNKMAEASKNPRKRRKKW